MYTLYFNNDDRYYIISLDGDELKFTDYKGGTEMATEINSLIFDDVVFERQ